MKKGFYFSMDAVVALLIMSASMTLVLQISDSSSSEFATETSQYSSISTTGRDNMRLASAQNLESLNESFKEKLRPEVGDEAMNKSILNGISLLWAKGNRTAAAKLAKTYFDGNIPEGYEYAVNISESGQSYNIYSSEDLEGSPNIVTSSSTLVSGHRINRSSTGYRSRALLTEVGKNATKRSFMGGYVGQGLVSFNVSLENVEEIKNFTVRGDFSSPFDLYINEQQAGSYSYSPGNLTVDNHRICTSNVNQTRCEALQSGYNNITYDFTGENKSIRGGIMKIKYEKTSEIDVEGSKYLTKKKMLPGISGVINYYDSFYVPGKFEGMDARLHYEVDNRTVFIQVGNTTIYKEDADGENTVELDNETISDAFDESEMGYNNLGQKTVPLRVGLGDISTEQNYRGAIADSVSVMDVSGSMGCGFFESPPCKIDEAIDASNLFVDIVLNASGNRAGFVSYNQDVVDTQNLTDDQNPLEDTINDQTAAGNTCIGCGILESTEIIKDPYIVDAFQRGANWSYTNEYLNGTPPEKGGENWASRNFDDGNWSNGSTLIGSESGAETILDDFEGSVYLRKEFDLNHTFYRNTTLNLLSNDRATVYLNGELVDNDSYAHQGKYWNREELINKSSLREGSNVLAVRLGNSENDTKRWETGKQEEWNNGSYLGTESVDGGLELQREFTGTPQDIDATVYPQISGSTSGRYFFYSWETYIDNVQITGIDRTTGDNGGYIDATDSNSDVVVPGNSYNVEVTFQNSGDTDFAPADYGSVVLDWDGDDQIDDNEVVKIGSCSEDRCSVSTDIDVPEDAQTGNTLMRVMGEEGSYHTDPTADPTLNEVEDYSIYVDEPVYQNGSYTSGEFNVSDTVNWSSLYTEQSTSSETDIGLEFRSDSEWYDNLSQVSNSESIQFRAQLNTTNNSKTPRLDLVDIGYLVDESKASFDASLNLTEQRRRSMVVMSDGAPNRETSMSDVPDHNEDGTVDAYDHAIEAACRANERHDIKVYSVGFGDNADEELMRQVAECGGGQYYYANTAELEQVFRDISERILEASFVGQTVRDSQSKSILYPDSYLNFNYTGSQGLEYGTINLRLNSEEFGGEVESPKEKDVNIPNGTDSEFPADTGIKSAKVSSYSGNRWTSIVESNGSGEFNTVFDLSNYGSNFPALGDPFTVNIPNDDVSVGTNRIRVNTANEPGNPKGASPDNRVFYTLSFSNSIGYGALFPNKTLAQQDARKRLERKLDFNDDGEPDVDIGSDDFQYGSNVLGDEPYLWGPANVKLVIWNE